jgi:preprotein translocase subunit SecF
MLVGTITGCYSTMFIASPCLLWLGEPAKAKK